MTEPSDLIHAYGIFLGLYFAMVVVVCVVLIFLWRSNCDCDCDCDCHWNCDRDCGDDGCDDGHPFGFEERDRCPCGGFTAEGQDGTYRWGWHRSECPRLGELGPF